ncbi:hypothetical protein ACMZ7K_06215, partial [Gardnerella pickettii]|uniref:hypothetical protein n=1 Tax=Gardnerella pickettii TaxID=2914924 RepID=UPI0039F0AC09
PKSKSHPNQQDKTIENTSIHRSVANTIKTRKKTPRNHTPTKNTTKIIQKTRKTPPKHKTRECRAKSHKPNTQNNQNKQHICTQHVRVLYIGI